MKNRTLFLTILGLVLLAVIISIYISFKEEKTDLVITKNSKIEDIVYEKNKVNIYFFWGQGCPHCEELFQFLEDTKGKYGKYYNIYCFEVWNNQTNAQTMDQFSKVLNDKVGRSVPYLIIGNQSFQGYNKTMNQKILNTILKESKKTTPDAIYQSLKENVQQVEP